MKRVTVNFSCAILIGIVLSLQTAGQTNSPAYEILPDRLFALQPDQPLSYFELAEELVDVADDETTLAMGQHLFRLAGALDPTMVITMTGLASLFRSAAPQLLLSLLVMLVVLGIVAQPIYLTQPRASR